MTALVTGAGTGIGLAIAKKFLSEGWQIVAVGRRQEPLNALADSAPAKVLALPCDLRNVSDVQKLSNELAMNAKFSALKVLINNAGAFERKTFEESDEAHWQFMMDANLNGPVRITRALLPLLKVSKGTIINISSTLGIKPIAATSAYSAAKAAVINWTETLALELAPFGMRVNCVAPGIVDTPIHAFHSQSDAEKAKLGPLQPLGRIGDPKDVAHAAWALSGPGSEWITGAVLQVDGGIHLV